jgi:hypothetical protein
MSLQLLETSSFDKEAPVTPGGYKRDSDDDSFPMQNDDDEDNPMPFGDDEDDFRPVAGRQSKINISSSNDVSSSNEETSGLVGGLDDSEEAQEADKPVDKKRRKRRSSGNVSNKKRKLTFDHGEEELPRVYLKNQFNNAPGVHMQNPGHPTTLDPKQQEYSFSDRLQEELADSLGYTRLFFRPGVANRDYASNSLLDTILLTLAEAAGNPLEFEVEPETAETIGQNVDEEEFARRSDGPDRSDEIDDNDNPFPMDDDNDFPPANNDDEEDAPVPFDDDDEMADARKNGSGFMADVSGMVDSKCASVSLWISQAFLPGISHSSLLCLE